jgi:hypothetical protein
MRKWPFRGQGQTWRQSLYRLHENVDAKLVLQIKACVPLSRRVRDDQAQVVDLGGSMANPV